MEGVFNIHVEGIKQKVQVIQLERGDKGQAFWDVVQGIDLVTVDRLQANFNAILGGCNR